MQINGNIYVYSGNQLITKGKNLITNSGKQIFLDWLSHNSYQNVDKGVYQGKSLSSQRFISDFTFYFSGLTTSSQTDNVKMFYSNLTENNIQVNNSATLYVNFNRITKVSGVYINAKTKIQGNHTYDNTANYVKIYYSTDVSTQAIEKCNWTLLKIVQNSGSKYSNKQMNNSKMIRFDSVNTIDGYIQALSFKLQFVCYSDVNIFLRGLGFLQKTPYPNIPCAIALGSGKNSPMLTDTTLQQDQNCKLFVNKQYCNYQKTISSNSSDGSNSSLSSQLIKLDLNGKLPSSEQLINVNKINIVYVTRLNYNEYNGIEFNQIGLFYPGRKNNDSDELNIVNYKDGTSSCNRMFSHGLFEQTWVKNSFQVIDIKYIISITV